VEPVHHQLEPLQKRFALRLAAALDALGYPVNKVDRSKSLGAAIGADQATSSSFLGGYLLPDHSQLLFLCDLVHRDPGYFFDDHVSQLPPGTCVVRSLGAGEDLVVRLPTDEVSPLASQRGLVYVRSKVAMGFGIAAGEYLIALKPGPIEAEPKRLYLFSDDQGLAVRRCVEVSAGRAIFHGDGHNEVPLIISTAAGKAYNASMQVGQLVASVRCGASLHER
jgi:hypothetical protein